MEPRHGATYEQILTLARATDAAGFDAFFRSDHLFGVDPTDPTYRPTECWTTLAGLARETTRIRLGTLVTAATMRHPGQLATMVATVDEMSGGRFRIAASQNLMRGSDLPDRADPGGQRSSEIHTPGMLSGRPDVEQPDLQNRENRTYTGQTAF